MTTAYLSSEPLKIAVLHAKALGDFIVTLPALAAIKETYPHAELVLLAKPWVKKFLAARPSVIDRVISVPALSAGLNKPINSAEVELFCAAMKTEKFDIILHMQGDGRTVNSFINKLGAGLTAGMRNPPAEPLDRFIPYVHYQNEVLRNLEIAALIGAYTSKLEPQVEVTQSDEQEAAPVRAVIKGRPYVVIHAGADDIRRLWPASKFAGVADSLIKKGYEIVLTGMPKETEIVTNVMRAMNGAAILCTSLELGGLAALLQNSALVISNDTGPLHLARAVGASTVGIFWAPNVLNWGPLSRSRHRLAISWRLECPQCRIKPVSPWPFQPVRPDCDHPYSFVENIPVAEVLEPALELLSAAKI
ncbi:ADP-heptose:LPS heptosyltransferase [Candidatus Methylobacter favarea]|uniref:ADP-heptose:LPS heptosyltransferase n=1 Tax=Candidatus Methylobacter favarea TaxID=2707345 RepID=A0A8S0WKX6_9GAMM|nr:glycosyltransferase family 9 protein [Candidatus Methylobacter favarea]CAA9892270.1 ADP-heptose:LPS heptosyltransferase [Candidatus Methylobacter favarea]